MSNPTIIQKIADENGIASSYEDVCGNKISISDACREDTLRLLGWPVEDDGKVDALKKKRLSQLCSDMLDPCEILNDEDLPFIFIRTRSDIRESAVITWSFEFEDGTRHTVAEPLLEIEIADYFTLDDQEYDLRRFIIPRDLKIPYGYHHFSCVVTDGYRIFNSRRLLFIRVPSKTYAPAEAMHKKMWGVSVQLYALRSKNNWGIGDFADLKELLGDVSACGGQFVGLNPMHAGYPASPDPCNCSPYSPSSRLWLNIAYISVPSIPEFVNCKEACEAVASPSFQKALKALREREYVDWHAVIELKLKIMRLIFTHCRVDDKRSIRGRKFLDFIEKGGNELLDMATYGAIQEDLFKAGTEASGWQAFPRELQRADSPFVEVWRNEHASSVRFYCYLQFIAQEQLDEAYEVSRLKQMSVGIYRDLAVGVSAGSCDVWADHDGIYRTEASIGAPPDPLGPLGQVWGLVPMDPAQLKQTGYKAVIDLYRCNMRSCGALRIDHAAGLNRLWWVREGNKASDGVYVNSDMHDLLGLICLESWRHKCVIIVEDLGTIPQALRDALSSCGALSYKIFLYERAPDGGFIAPCDYPQKAMAALTTHDMPTLKGWWNELDLTDGLKMGIYTEEEAQNLAKDRSYAKQRMFDSMRYFGTLDPKIKGNAADTSFSFELALSLQRHFCMTSCLLCSSQLEDWIGVEKPVNVPGTLHEYPNWRRKLTRNLNEIFDDPNVKTLTQAMTAARNRS